MKVKFCIGLDYLDLQRAINEALSEINSEKTNLIYFLDKNLAIIEYEPKEQRKCMCVDCAHYDPSGDPYRKAYGLCQFHGERKRFNETACRSYLDVR